MLPPKVRVKRRSSGSRATGAGRGSDPSARRVRSVELETGSYYGAHWWCVGDEYGSFRCSGYEGQSILCVPALDLLVVRLGQTEAARYPLLTDWRRRVVEAFSAAQ